jgi:hypothetical protein
LRRRFVSIKLVVKDEPDTLKIRAVFLAAGGFEVQMGRGRFDLNNANPLIVSALDHLLGSVF